MASARAQILRETDNQFTLLFFQPNADGVTEDLVSTQPNLASLSAALDAAKPLAGALPGTIFKVTIGIQTR